MRAPATPFFRHPMDQSANERFLLDTMAERRAEELPRRGFFARLFS